MIHFMAFLRKKELDSLFLRIGIKLHASIVGPLAYQLQVMVHVLSTCIWFLNNRKQGFIISKKLNVTIHISGKIVDIHNPAKMSPKFEHCPFKTVRCFRSSRKLWMGKRIFPIMPHLFSLKITVKCFRNIKLHGTYIERGIAVKCHEHCMCDGN